jgi:hypothetical protein
VLKVSSKRRHCSGESGFYWVVLGLVSLPRRFDHPYSRIS